MKFLNEIDGAKRVKQDSSNRFVTDVEKASWNSKAEGDHNHSTLYEPKNTNIQSHISNKSNPHSVSKAQVGLGSVNNTSDTEKPISTAQQTALNLKANKTELHNHTNKTILDKFAETLGKPTYNGEALGGASRVLSTEGVTTLSGSSNTASINIPNFDRDRDTLIVYRNSVYADDYVIDANNLNIRKKVGSWDAGTVFNFVAFQIAKLADDNNLLDDLMIIRREEFTATEGQRVFPLSLGSYVPNGNRLSVYIWGTKQYNNAFSETDGTSFTMTQGLSSGDRVIAEWIETIDVQGFYGGHGHTHSRGGGDQITPEMIGAESSAISPSKPASKVTMWYEEVL